MKSRRTMLFGFCVLAAFPAGCSQGGRPTGEEEYERLDAFVEAALGDQVSAEQAKVTYESLDAAQRDLVRQLVEAKTGLDEGEEQVAEASEAPVPEPLAKGTAWQEHIENVWTFDFPNKVFSSLSYEDCMCDDDPEDMEYVFYFPQSSQSPSTLRWTTTSARVYLVFIAAYGGNLLGFGYSNAEVRLCIGDKGVAAAGGENDVKSSVFVHY